MSDIGTPVSSLKVWAQDGSRSIPLALVNGKVSFDYPRPQYTRNLEILAEDRAGQTEHGSVQIKGLQDTSTSEVRGHNNEALSALISSKTEELYDSAYNEYLDLKAGSWSKLYKDYLDCFNARVAELGAGLAAEMCGWRSVKLPHWSDHLEKAEAKRRAKSLVCKEYFPGIEYFSVDSAGKGIAGAAYPASGVGEAFGQVGTLRNKHTANDKEGVINVPAGRWQESGVAYEQGAQVQYATGNPCGHDQLTWLVDSEPEYRFYHSFNGDRGVVDFVVEDVAGLDPQSFDLLIDGRKCPVVLDAQQNDRRFVQSVNVYAELWPEKVSGFCRLSYEEGEHVALLSVRDATGRQSQAEYQFVLASMPEVREIVAFEESEELVISIVGFDAGGDISEADSTVKINDVPGAFRLSLLPDGSTYELLSRVSQNSQGEYKVEVHLVDEQGHSDQSGKTFRLDGGDLVTIAGGAELELYRMYTQKLESLKQVGGAGTDNMFFPGDRVRLMPGFLNVGNETSKAQSVRVSSNDPGVVLRNTIFNIDSVEEGRRFTYWQGIELFIDETVLNSGGKEYKDVKLQFKTDSDEKWEYPLRIFRDRELLETVLNVSPATEGGADSAPTSQPVIYFAGGVATSGMGGTCGFGEPFVWVAYVFDYDTFTFDYQGVEVFVDGAPHSDVGYADAFDIGGFAPYSSADLESGSQSYKAVLGSLPFIYSYSSGQYTVTVDFSLSMELTTTGGSPASFDTRINETFSVPCMER